MIYPNFNLDLYRSYLKNKFRHLLENITYIGDGPNKWTMGSDKALDLISQDQRSWLRMAVTRLQQASFESYAEGAP
jgi:hypothetical protein